MRVTAGAVKSFILLKSNENKSLRTLRYFIVFAMRNYVLHIF